jgi:osmotically inducible protein OsmC
MSTRHAEAEWEGSIQEGRGKVRVESGAVDTQYSFQGRFEEGIGTNPEELVGAAHAGCFTMALSGVLTQAGTPPDSLHSTADVTVKMNGPDDIFISKIHLTTRGSVPGVSEEDFLAAANGAKDNCPLSKALASVPEITLDAKLEG